jgi:hypothetical protein
MAKPKPILRRRTVSTKVTEEDFAGLEAQASERWLKPYEVPGNATLLAEVMPLRTIVINLAGA